MLGILPIYSIFRAERKEKPSIPTSVSKLLSGSVDISDLPGESIYLFKSWRWTK